MIRLIASDMDGTLVENVNSPLPEGLIELIETMYGRGIRFAVATGRQYSNVEALFRPVRDKIYFICEGGGVTFYRDEILDRQTLSTGHEHELIDDIRNAPGARIWITGERRGYLLGDDPDYVRLMRDEVHASFDIQENLHAITEPMLKISLLQFLEPEVRPENYDFFSRKYGDIYQVMKAGHGFLDFIGKGAGKGKALKSLMARLGIGREETVVFGDNENDVSMFREAGLSYAMQSSYAHVKAQADRVTGNVPEEMKKLLKESEGVE